MASTIENILQSPSDGVITVAQASVLLGYERSRIVKLLNDRPPRLTGTLVHRRLWLLSRERVMSYPFLREPKADTATISKTSILAEDPEEADILRMLLSPGDEAITVAQATTILNVKSSRVRNFLNEIPPRLRGVRLTSRLWLLSREQVEEFAKVERPDGKAGQERKAQIIAGAALKLDDLCMSTVDSVQA